MEQDPRREAQAEAGVSGEPAGDSDEDVAGGSLDVSSESFDPLLALYSPRTPLPYPAVRCFNNLAEYESFLRGGGRARGRARGAPKPAKKGGKPAPDPERVERLKKLMVAPGPEDEQKPKPVRRGQKPAKNVLTRMPFHQGGPLGVLHRCVQEHLKVNVHIRTFKGLRGVCSGFVVAFDKFWNMAMVDVDETYRKPILGQAYHHEPKLTLTRLFDRLKLQESGVLSSSETQTAAEKTPLAAPTPHAGSSDRKSSCRDPGRSSHPPAKGFPPHVQDSDKAKQRTKQQKEKPDYHKVFTRHMKQVFIRGENILLIHLPQ
ncbi:U7 snRNA-associated Sm-like protein LSm11 [Gastrophryne carolinensis]